MGLEQISGITRASGIQPGDHTWLGRPGFPGILSASFRTLAIAGISWVGIDGPGR
ncbi:MAG: hypothetical protein VYA08_09040 [Pseudomonadota bacterium]|nr:hypothetical protein [Pseudomonadota bacterium]